MSFILKMEHEWNKIKNGYLGNSRDCQQSGVAEIHGKANHRVDLQETMCLV